MIAYSVVINCLLNNSGHAQKYDQLSIMKDIVAKDINIFKVDVPGEQRGWKRT